MADTVLTALIGAFGVALAAAIGWVGRLSTDLYARLRAVEEENEQIRMKNIVLLTWAGDMIRMYVRWSKDDAPPPPPLPEV